MHHWIRLDELYKAMESFFKFWLIFQIIGRKPKNIQTNSEGVNIDQISIFYISVDSSRQALQTNGKLSNFVIIFRINYNLLK